MTVITIHFACCNLRQIPVLVRKLIYVNDSINNTAICGFCLDKYDKKDKGKDAQVCNDVIIKQ